MGRRFGGGGGGEREGGGGQNIYIIIIEVVLKNISVYRNNCKQTSYLEFAGI